MKRNIWLINHYASNHFSQRGGRHYYLARHLLQDGHKVSVFGASTNHATGENTDLGQELYYTEKIDDVPFTYIRTPRYSGNGMSRLRNILAFYKNLFKVSRRYASTNGKPDVIVASSVHPLTMVAGVRIAKKMNILCICEVRDLWPESLIAYGKLSEGGLLAKILYRGEKWIYSNADKVVMTLEGGKKYILDKGWEEEIALEKIVYISNGVDITSFDALAAEHSSADPELCDSKYINVVYTGSIRQVNNLGLILDAAKKLELCSPRLRFLIYGSGTELEKLTARVKNEKIGNVVFKGRVSKQQIPGILVKSDILLLHNQSTRLDKYGQSQNKLFEYLAAGRTIFQTYRPAYSIVDRFDCGISLEQQSIDAVVEGLQNIIKDPDSIRKWGDNSRKASLYYDYSVLSKRLLETIEARL